MVKAVVTDVDGVLTGSKEKIHLIWSHNPMTDPWESGVISSKGVSKASASKYVADIFKIDMKYILGIGDGLADWVFMQECGYAGVVGEKSPELLDLVTTKGEGKYFLAPSVDENGVVDMFRNFNLI